MSCISGHRQSEAVAFKRYSFDDDLLPNENRGREDEFMKDKGKAASMVHDINPSAYANANANAMQPESLFSKVHLSFYMSILCVFFLLVCFKAAFWSGME